MFKLYSDRSSDTAATLEPTENRTQTKILRFSKVPSALESDVEILTIKGSKIGY